MTTYTIAYLLGDNASVLLAIVPDGQDVEAAVAAESEKINEDLSDYETESGLILTDDEPENASQIVWSGHSYGWISDETGRIFQYIVRG